MRYAAVLVAMFCAIKLTDSGYWGWLVWGAGMAFVLSCERIAEAIKETKR